MQGSSKSELVVTPVLPFTRAVFVLGVSLTAGTGVALYAMPDRTADYWAWTIGDPPSAAFFGAGYIGAAVSLLLGARAREWRQARVVAVSAITLTSLALVATLLYPDPFAFGEGGVPELVSWIWLAVYVALPPLAFAAFVLQERRGGRREYRAGQAALGLTRAVLGAAGALMAALGIALLADWGPLVERWPWPLPPLPAGVLGAWLATYAAGLLWFALFEREWRPVRIGVLAGAIAFALHLAAAWRLRESFEGGAATAAYVAALAILLAAVAAAAVVERRAASAEPRFAGADSGEA